MISILPDIFDKYKIDIVDSGFQRDFVNSQIVFHDINNDGISEQIISYELAGRHSIQVLTLDGGTIDQWNTLGIPLLGKRLTVGDFDKDGFKEIYTFYQKNDSVFLFSFEPLDSISPRQINSKLVSTLTKKYNEPDPQIVDIKLQDINGDQKEELVFIIVSGQARFPRNVLAYDISKDSLISSANYGSTLTNDLKFVDFENDGKFEITGNNLAAGQVQERMGYPFSDYNAWLMVYNHDLKLRFEPLKFSGFLSALQIEPIELDNQKLLVCFYNHLGTLENFPKLLLLNGTGTLIKELNFPKSSKIERSLRVSYDQNTIQFNIIDAKGKINVYNRDFKLIKEHHLNYDIRPYTTRVDLDNNGSKEWLFSSIDNGLLITDQDFRNPVILKHHFPLNSSPSPIIMNGIGTPSMFLYFKNEYIIIKYGKNPLADLKYLVYIGIYLAVWLFISFIRKLQLIQLQKNERIRSQIVNLQLKSYRSQMDPHFTFNVFNTIAYKIKKENPKSYAAFMEFSNLIRKMLLSSDSITRSIEDELSHLKSYLELEKLRLPDKLSYSIAVEKEIDMSTLIPKMILQTYVENAIKHGIRHKNESGSVTILISKNNNNLLIEIIDDGIGREQAKAYSNDSTGFGLKIMDNYFSLFNEYNVSKITYEIIDLFDDQQLPKGTKVKILVPLNFSYKLKKQ